MTMHLRVTSNLVFGLAIGCTALLQTCPVPRGLAWLGMVSVLAAMLLTNLMWIRSVGLAGIGGLSLVYSNLGEYPVQAAAYILVAAALVVGAVLLAMLADLTETSKGKSKIHES